MKFAPLFKPLRSVKGTSPGAAALHPGPGPFGAGQSGRERPRRPERVASRDLCEVSALNDQLHQPPGIGVNRRFAQLHGIHLAKTFEPLDIYLAL